MAKILFLSPKRKEKYVSVCGVVWERKILRWGYFLWWYNVASRSLTLDSDTTSLDCYERHSIEYMMRTSYIFSELKCIL